MGCNDIFFTVQINDLALSKLKKAKKIILTQKRVWRK